jgi:hypothetical protein
LPFFTTHLHDGAPSQAAGNTKDSAAARSASATQPMNPRRWPLVLTHTLARLIPLHDSQGQVYRLAEKHPPGFEDGFTPIWECATALLPARQTTQLRINFQNQFHLLAVLGGCTLAGGFRVQLYDMKKNYGQGKPGVRLAGRGVNFATFLGAGFNAANAAGIGSSQFTLREPHPFTEPNAQCLVIVQNQDTSATSNQIQVVLYGQARRFNWPD